MHQLLSIRVYYKCTIITKSTISYNNAQRFTKVANTQLKGYLSASAFLRKPKACFNPFKSICSSWDADDQLSFHLLEAALVMCRMLVSPFWAIFVCLRFSILEMCSFQKRLLGHVFYNALFYIFVTSSQTSL